METGDGGQQAWKISFFTRVDACILAAESGWEKARPWLSVMLFSRVLTAVKDISPAPIDLRVIVTVNVRR